MAALDLSIDNMHCGACVRRVTQTLNALPGTHADSVQVGTARVTTGSTPDQTAALLQALEAAGFPARITSPQP